MALPPLTVWNALNVVGFVASGWVAYRAWQNRDRPTARMLVALMASGMLWISSNLVGQMMGSAWTYELMAKVEFVWIPTTVFFYLLFALRYGGYEQYVEPRTALVLALHPVLVTILIFTNHLHGLFWTTVQVSFTDAGAVQTTWARGPFWYVHAVYSYVALLGSTGLVLWKTYDRDDTYRGQGIAIALAVLTPLAANALYIGVLSNMFPNATDITPAGFAVTGLALLWGMRSYGITEVTPVARENIIDNLSDGILAVDAQGTVSEVNGATREMFDLGDRTVIGERFEDAFSHLPALVERYADVEETTDEIRVEIDEGDPRSYEVQVRSLVDSGGSSVGRLFTFHDVTERKRRERELELQNRQLDQFASLISHEIQSPLDDVRDRLDGALDRVATENRGDLLQAKQSLDDVDELVDDVLSMASEGGAVRSGEAERLDLETVADRAWWSVTERQLPATLSVDGGTIIADPDRLERVFVNLFENAIRYGGEDVAVEVGLIDDEATGTRGFYVEDDGPGIPADARSAVFEAGVAGPDDSTGLGLTIVETMADAHDWDVRVVDGDRGGARFEFTGVDVPDTRTGRQQGILGTTPTDD